MYLRKEDKPIVIEQVFENSVEEIWKALTEVDKMKLWFFSNIPDFKAEVGFTTTFTVETESRSFTHKWTIIEVIENQKIVYDWSYDNYKGVGNVIYEIIEEGGYRTVRLTNIIIENFPENIDEFTRESSISGWKYFIKKSLKSFIK